MDLWKVALGFMDSQLLLTATELGVFDRLDGGPRTAAEIAAELRLPEDSAERLLTALTTLGVLRRDEDGRYRNGPEAGQQLVRGRPGYIGAMFHHVRHNLYPVWHHLEGALRERAPQWHRAFPDRESPTAAVYDDPRALRAFMDGMHEITYKAAAEFARRDVPQVARLGSLVDVGGASGAFVIALAERVPSLQGTVYDLPPVRPIAEDYFARAGMSDRLSFEPGNFWTDPIPAGADAYALGFILHDWDDDGGSRLLSKIAGAAPRGARLIVGEYLLADDRSGPHHVARQDLNMLVSARGRERTLGEYRAWLGEHGFEYERVELTSSGKNFLVARRSEATV